MASSSTNEKKNLHSPRLNVSRRNSHGQIAMPTQPSMMQPTTTSPSYHVDPSQDYSYSESGSTTNTESETVRQPHTNQSVNMQSWDQLVGPSMPGAPINHEMSQSDSTNQITTSFGFPQQTSRSHRESPPVEITGDMDYQTLVQTRHLYFDPNPHMLKKTSGTGPVLYKQNVMIRFLEPPAVPVGPLIIREVRPPQPPPPPPLVIRQRAPPPLSPPPIILRERPPVVPTMMTAKMVTKTLPLPPPPPRSVVIERLPPLPPKPRDIIIERWIPYDAMHRRKVIVQRAEAAIPYPTPRNTIITYEPQQARIVRQFERMPAKPEDPQRYMSTYQSTLLSTEQLLAQIRELGITDDISIPEPTVNELHEAAINQEASQQARKNSFPREPHANGSQSYNPTYENLVNGRPPPMGHTEGAERQQQQQQPITSRNHHFHHHYYSNGDDLPSQLAEYGMTPDSIPY